MVHTKIAEGGGKPASLTNSCVLGGDWDLFAKHRSLHSNIFSAGWFTCSCAAANTSRPRQFQWSQQLVRLLHHSDKYRQSDQGSILAVMTPLTLTAIAASMHNILNIIVRVPGSFLIISLFTDTVYIQ